MAEGDLMLYVGGSKIPFRCSCGANVFRSTSKAGQYRCNGCPALYTNQMEATEASADAPEEPPVALTSSERAIYYGFTEQRHFHYPVGDEYQAVFKVGVQEFNIAIRYRTPEEADWMRAMFSKAIMTLIDGLRSD